MDTHGKCGTNININECSTTTSSEHSTKNEHMDNVNTSHCSTDNMEHEYSEINDNELYHTTNTNGCAHQYENAGAQSGDENVPSTQYESPPKEHTYSNDQPVYTGLEHPDVQNTTI